MFARMSALVAAVCVVGALLIVFVARGMFLLYHDQAGETAVAATDPAPRRTTVRYAAPAPSRFDAVALGRAQQRLDELQAELLQMTATLEEKTRLLEQKSAECRDLETKLDVSADFVTALLAEDRRAEDESQPVEAALANGVEPESRQVELEQAQRLQAESQQQLERLRQELMQAEQQRVALEETASREITALLEERLVLEAAAGQALLQVGEPATAALIELLRHEHAEVRLWAAVVLGRMGPAAQSAVEPLSNLRRDSDRRVAAEARRALSSIEP